MLQDFWVEQSFQGKFTLEGRHDILASTIRRCEHLERVHDVGFGIDIQHYFGGSLRHTSYSYSDEYEERLTQEITKKVKAQLCDQVTSKVIKRVIRQFQ